MKKVLALVLVAAMLLSCMVVGLSAARVVTAETTTNKVWTFPAGNSYNPVAINQSGTFDVAMDIRVDDAAGKLTGWSGLAVGPYVGPDGVGIDNADIAMAIEVGTWYNVQWNVTENGTAIYVNGEHVGTIGEYIGTYSDGSAFWTWDKITIDNFKAGSFFDDMEGAGIGGQGMQITEETTTYKNENVMKGVDKIWTFPAGNSYNPVAVNQYAPFDVSMEIRVDDAAGKLTGWSGLAVGPYVAVGGVGVDGAEFAYDIQQGQWYDVEWKVVDEGTAIYVDGAYVGTSTKQITTYSDGSAFWTWDKISIDDLAVGDFFDDMEGSGIGGQGMQLEEEYEGARYDLGKYFWCFPAGNSYNPVMVNESAPFDVELDICIDDAAGKLTGWSGLAVGPYVAVGAIGVDGADFEVDIEQGEWYHVAFINNDGSTEIYLDDAYVGTVDKELTTYSDGSAFWTWDKISIDNLSVGDFFDDMEGSGIGGQGMQLEYDIDIVGEDLFDKIDITAPAAGEALLIESSQDIDATSGYIELSDRFATNKLNNNYIITYDIAYTQTKESAQGAFLEYWTNWNGGTPVRWAVGTVSGGKGEDQILFDWGEATFDNFHEITFEYDMMKANIYVDGVLFYEGNIGLNNFDLGLSLLCMWYGNAIIDNFQLIDGETYEVVADQSDLPTGTGYNRGSGEMRIVNLDTDDFCAENGHTNGWSTVQYDSTCVAEGYVANVCAVCGADNGGYSIPMKAHNWAGYDINRKTDDGLVYTYCKNGGDCTQKYYIELPAADAYTGSIYQYHDFQDDFMNVMENGWGYDNNWVCDNGTFSSKNGVSNYNDHYLPGYVNSNDFSMSWDMAIQGLVPGWDEGSDQGYAPEVYAWIGGASGYAFMIGYNYNDQYLFIRPTNEGAFTPITADYAMVNGEVYNFSVNFKLNLGVDGAPPSGRLSVFVNGEEVLYTTSRSIVAQQFAKSYTSNDHLSFVILRNFHVDMNIDNYTIGSSDFAWNRTYKGDVSGDFVLDADDVLLMRKYLAKVTGDIVTSRADANADGAINAKDQLTIRKALAA
ncbi:MAG: hypothetical protein IJA52_01535 [Clostridia bacterium]|nr:hypothetical protein [Clostridia bacterium]